MTLKRTEKHFYNKNCISWMVSVLVEHVEGYALIVEIQKGNEKENRVYRTHNQLFIETFFLLLYCSYAWLFLLAICCCNCMALKGTDKLRAAVRSSHAKEASSHSKEALLDSKEAGSNSKEAGSNSKEASSNSKEKSSNSKEHSSEHKGS